MARGLTKKQRGFVKDYVQTGIGSLAAKKNFDVTNDESARAVASRALTNVNVIKAIADRLPDDLLEQRHLELLNKREKITLHVNDEFGKPIQVDLGPDVPAVSKGLDMAYKLKGSYAPEKSQALNVNVGLNKIENSDLEDIRERYEEELKGKLLL